MTGKHRKGLGFGIDRGGTFTDVFVVYPDGRERTFKLLSEDFANYADAPTEAIRRILNEYTGRTVERYQKIPTDNISWIRMGTTVATNALLERKGEKTALLITHGFKDLLYIGNQSRPKIFDFDIRVPPPLYEAVFEVDERVLLADDPSDSGGELRVMPLAGQRVATASGKEVIIERPIRTNNVEEVLSEVRRRGICSLAVLFLHSYIYPDHEQFVEAAARRVGGFTNISLSSAVIPMIKAVPRGFTTTADAYLTPVIRTYIEGFRSGFADNLAGVELEFMQSDGGLCPVDSFLGSRAILSGPAGGVVGVSLTAYGGDSTSSSAPIIGFDMGGTSTDVSRYTGNFSHAVESVTAGVTIQAPQLEICTVAAGGGSRLFYRNGMFAVGPESAGSTPGPVCYRKPGGSLTVTDANLVLGRILPEHFPHIFGPTEDQPLDKAAAERAFERLTAEVNESVADSRPAVSIRAAALGFINVANETMCRPIRTLTEAKGFDTSAHVLACFGGAGGQHACAIARKLGMRRVKIHRYAGILSAYGLALADVVVEQQEPCIHTLVPENYGELERRLDALAEKCHAALVERHGFVADGGDDTRLTFERILHARYARTDCVLMCSSAELTSGGNFLDGMRQLFTDKYRREFGFVIADRDICVDDLRVRGSAKRHVVAPLRQVASGPKADIPALPTPLQITKCTFSEEEEVDTAVFRWSDLPAGSRIDGPAIIIDSNCTIVVESECEAHVDASGNVELILRDIRRPVVGSADVDPIQLSIFSHRFMSIAEQMGTVLQRSAISTNIKERLDFSCALFDAGGGLVANAPHIPVHLGGMQATVKFQLEHFGADGFRRNDVILCNHPKAGGSHLPDLTIITPVFCSPDSRSPDFFVANRGHHSDIGGLVPGSMPPHSHCLAQEGAAFIAFKIVEGGVFNEKSLIEQLQAPGNYPGCTGTRNLRDNLADLNAQIAANQKGINLLDELVDAYGMDVVQAYMQHIQSNAESAVRRLLITTAKRRLSGSTSATNSNGDQLAELHAEDRMDDGTFIRLRIAITQTGEALFDFTGTGPQVHSSCNTPPAVRMAAVIYCLRCLIGEDIPLNQGCLAPITISVPNGTILSPSDDAAVVGGNVLTSQRICDVILLAFEAVAASQGCMNNVTFGDERMGGYYETVAGGAGAGPNFNGRHGIHTHMTNTRITDPEMLESRYPVIVRRFFLRAGSGGAGRWRGGDGVSRHLQFRRDGLQLSVLTERRVFAPYGLHGGEAGALGANSLRRARDGVRVNLGGKTSIPIEAGDTFELETPGGGGYGTEEAKPIN